MKADLVRREPEFRKKWDEMDLYGLIRKARAGCPKYILHDGPPYPTGDLHIGTGLNKILKDLVVKYKTMQGYDAPYVPGWDCHGLPIEHRVMQELGPKAKELSKAQIRDRCRQYAMKFVALQREQFKALGVLGDWENPYLTLQPEYEAGVIDVFRVMVQRGFIYRSLKPIHWCIECETALAEAELEYSDEVSPSIYVNFPMTDDVSDLFGKADVQTIAMMIWTTTPWTLPANLAIAVHPEAEYVLIEYQNPRTSRLEATIVAERLADSLMQFLGINNFKRVGKTLGKQLAGRRYRHVFMKRVSPVVLADYVSLTDGTGCVHTAPGHGQEDYITGRNNGLPALSPVDSQGIFTAEAGPFKGMNIYDGNAAIVKHLDELGVLLHAEEIKHSYPHCWRCNKPVIFRATEQWFVSVDHNQMRKAALECIKNVKWVPAWGMERIAGMVAERPDWCISRQRAWGVPIPAFYCTSCGAVLLNADSVAAVRDVFRKEGADSWFSNTAVHFLKPDTRCAHCGGRQFRQESDIFDVWFESGSSWRSVLCERDSLAFPADMYLEGQDQHRGWFQLSLLPAVATRDCAPYRTVLTHGFVVDEKGEKMSKSKGNFISVEEAVKKFGGDITRLWTSSLDYRNDMSVSFPLIERMSDAYRRIRNTFRYLLGCIHDFNPATDSVPYAELPEIDRWALGRTQILVRDVTRAMEDYEFHKLYHLIHNFCAVDMSAIYLDILKDRVYTSGRTSKERRAAQTVFHHVLLTLVRLCAPVLSYTADEVWWHIEHKDEDVPSVHLAHWPKPNLAWVDEKLNAKWDRLMTVRSDVARQLEKARAAKLIGSALEAHVTLATQDEKLYDFLKAAEADLPTLFITSQVTLIKGDLPGGEKGVDIPELCILVEVSKYPKCERCWNYRQSVGQDKEHPTLCARCVGVVKQIG